MAVQNGHFLVVDYLLRASAKFDLNRMIGDDIPLIAIAAEGNHVKVMTVIVFTSRSIFHVHSMLVV